jgi:nicotinate (nicotinamide) nucleotide adenylyltransferase
LSKRIAILAGAFNPLTRAHIALARAASSVVDELVCVVPRVFPHKQIEGARLDQRLEMLHRTPYRVETTEGGLFIEIAREIKAREPQSEIFFVCGRDAAERVLNWDYGEPGFAQRMLDEFGLLVAARQGEFVAPEPFNHHVIPILLNGGFDDVSSTEVRRRISAGEPWEHLVPEEIVDLVREVYGRR